jgi:DNA-nicking Smr family endonuclease
MKRRRGLSPEDAELWARVVASANRLGGDENLPASELPPAKPAPAKLRTSVTLPPGPPPGPGSVSFDLRPSLSDRLAAQRVDMDRKKFGRLRRGKLDPEARLDLHGMTRDQAHAELTAFILLSHQIGRRLVLVITGKGGPVHAGVLRQQVPHWLNLPPLKPCVLQLAEAHRSHGGTGALYVYLRRQR